MWKNQSVSDSQFFKKVAKDDAVMIGNFDAAHKLLNCGETSLETRFPTFRSKLDLFFIDYDMIPLLV